MERFYQETRALSALNHANILVIIDRGYQGGTYYFVMEYVEGRGIDELIRDGIGVTEFVAIVQQICAGLAYAHRRGVIHRDIKPMNIMVKKEGEVKIADFGLAGLMEREVSEFGEAAGEARVMGTPRYMSPEQRVSSATADPRSDIYSLGVVMYEMLTGQVPTGGDFIPPSLMNESADPRLDPVVARCFEQRPQDRYQSAEELLADINLFTTELESAPPCPHCGALNPVRFRQCERCGDSLDSLFERCMACGHENRLDVRSCFSCGLDLHRSLQDLQARVQEMFSKYAGLKDEGNYSEAIDCLEQVLRIQGKAFEGDRQHAREALRSTREQRLAAARKAFQEGQRLFNDQHVREAIDVWRSIDPRALDVGKTIDFAEGSLKRIEQVTRSNRVSNILVVVAACIVIIILIIRLLIAKP